MKHILAILGLLGLLALIHFDMNVASSHNQDQEATLTASGSVAGLSNIQTQAFALDVGRTTGVVDDSASEITSNEGAAVATYHRDGFTGRSGTSPGAAPVPFMNINWRTGARMKTSTAAAALNASMDATAAVSSGFDVQREYLTGIFLRC